MADGFGPFLQPGIPSRMIPCRGYAGAFAVLGQRLRLTADCRMRNGRFRLLRPSPLCQSTRTISRISGTESSFPSSVSVPPPPIFSPGLSVSPHPAGCVTADVVSWPGRCVFVFGLSWFRGRSAVFSRPAVGGGLERFCSRRSGCVPAGCSSERGRRFPPRVSCFGCLPCRRVRRQFCASIVRLRNNC